MQHATKSHWRVADLLRRATDSIELTFCKLNRIQFSAPWSPQRRGC